MTSALATSFSDLACAASDPTVCGWLTRQIGNETTARVLTFALGKPLLVIGIIAAAIIVRWVAHRAIRRTVDRVITGGGFLTGSLDLLDRVDPISAQRRSQRTRAIGSLLTATVSVVIWSLAVLLVLPEIGVQIGGLLAGAGIIGLTLAFGAQTLIADLVSGIFMIAEDQFGVGDVIDMGEAQGVVEAVGLRTTRLRSLDGTVWHVRNGEVKRVGNSSQGWSRAVLDLEVGYTEDIAQVTQVLRELGRELAVDTEFGPKILEEPEVWGIEALGKGTVIIRMIIKTRPLEQWAVAREMRRRIKDGFQAAGVAMSAALEVRLSTESPTAAGPPEG